MEKKADNKKDRNVNKNGSPEENDDEANADAPETDTLDADSEAEGNTSDIGFILDIPLELSVELGRSKMLVIDLLGLSQGSIVELDKLAGEPLEIFINRKLVARGEVVVVNEKFGVRLTDIITPMERVRSLAGS
ncbi:MAG: flagellar motor switch protein FliN [Proteobacteria bacterium]|nr:flagellar motor switch protein FliN [Pseudomonadota bacterium]